MTSLLMGLRSQWGTYHCNRQLILAQQTLTNPHGVEAGSHRRSMCNTLWGGCVQEEIHMEGDRPHTMRPLIKKGKLKEVRQLEWEGLISCDLAWEASRRLKLNATQTKAVWTPTDPQLRCPLKTME